MKQMEGGGRRCVAHQEMRFCKVLRTQTFNRDLEQIHHLSRSTTSSPKSNIRSRMIQGGQRKKSLSVGTYEFVCHPPGEKDASEN